MNKPPEGEARYSISQAAILLDRTPHTLRSWDRQLLMPAALRPKRDARGHRYWTDDLIAKIKTWIAENDFHPGSGIDYHPDEQQVQKHLKNIRRSTRAKKISPPAEHPAVDVFQSAVQEAVRQHGVSYEEVVANLPKAIAMYPGLTLDAALRAVADLYRDR